MRRPNKLMKERERDTEREGTALFINVLAYVVLLMMMGLVSDPLSHSLNPPFPPTCCFILGVGAETLNERLRSEGHFTCNGTCVAG